MRYSTCLLPVLGLVCSAHVFGQQSPFYDPPLELKQSAIQQGVSFPAVASPIGVSLDVSLSPFDKRIELMWENRSTGEALAHRQLIPVGYTPTAVAAGASFGEVFVGGTNKFGYTKIVRYVFNSPDLDENQVPEDATVAEMDEVFGASKQSATRDVYQMLPNRAAPGRSSARSIRRREDPRRSYFVTSTEMGRWTTGWW